MKNKRILTIILVLIVGAGLAWIFKGTGIITTPELSVDTLNNSTIGCAPGLIKYKNDAYDFSMCIPEDAEVLNQFETENGEELDLVFVKKDDLAKLSDIENYATDPYFAILKSGISAFALQRLAIDAPVSETELRAGLPTQIPCPDKSLSCKEGSMLDIRVLEWEKIPSKNLLFRYRDEVSATKNWQDIGFIWADNKATYQIESIVPSNPISEEALRIITESFL